MWQELDPSDVYTIFLHAVSGRPLSEKVAFTQPVIYELVQMEYPLKKIFRPDVDRLKPIPDP